MVVRYSFIFRLVCEIPRHFLYQISNLLLNICQKILNLAYERLEVRTDVPKHVVATKALMFICFCNLYIKLAL